MSEFISWIQKGPNIFYLTEKQISSAKGKLLLNKKGNDLIGHEAIKKYYKLENVIDQEYKNRDFWNGKLPKPIRDSWNKGEFDYMLKFLQNNDLDYIYNHAPVGFSMWVLKEKFNKNNRIDFEAMKKDDYWVNRFIGYDKTEDCKGMKEDAYWINRLIGYIKTEDYEGMEEDDFRINRLIGYIKTEDFERMKKNDYWINRFIEYNKKGDLSGLKRPRIN